MLCGWPNNKITGNYVNEESIFTRIITLMYIIQKYSYLMYKLVIFRSIMIMIIEHEVSINIYLTCHRPDVELYYSSDYHSFTTVYQHLIIEETAQKYNSLYMSITQTTPNRNGSPGGSMS